jgi:hypothetical protein
VHSLFVGQIDQKRKNQLSAFCLKMTDDFFLVLVKVYQKTKNEKWNEPDNIQEL